MAGRRCRRSVAAPQRRGARPGRRRWAGTPAGWIAGWDETRIVVGTASVIDGDTIENSRHPHAARGKSAPTSPSSAASAAASATMRPGCGRPPREPDGRRPVTCEPSGTDRYGRKLAICFEGGEDLNRRMVLGGHAVAFRQYSQRYADGEDAARAARRGIIAPAKAPRTVCGCQPVAATTSAMGRLPVAATWRPSAAFPGW